MLNALVFATMTLVNGVPPELPPPLSPASLPPPKGWPKIWFQSIKLTASFDDCRRKAFTTLASLKGIKYLEATQDGLVWGYSDTERWTVLIVYQPTESVVITVLSSWNELQPELIGKTGNVADRIEKASVDPKSPLKIGERDRELEKKLPAISWRVEKKPTSSALRNLSRHFQNVMGMLSDKYDYLPVMVTAGTDNAGVTCLKQSDNWQVQIILMNEHVKGKEWMFIFLGLATDDDAASKDLKSFSNDLLRFIYE